MNSRDLAILDLLHHGYHPPAPAHPDHARLMAEWEHRYRTRLDAAERLLAAVIAVDAGPGDDVRTPSERSNAVAAMTAPLCAICERVIQPMNALTVTCRRCGRPFEPDPGAIRAGAWRTCPACRQLAESASPRPLADPGDGRPGQRAA